VTEKGGRELVRSRDARGAASRKGRWRSKGDGYSAASSEGAATQYKAVRIGVTQRGFDAQRKIGSGGKPTLMASQQLERTAKLQDPEVRAELNRRVRGCERECSIGGRLGSFLQVRACAKQRTTRKQVGSRWCGSRTGVAALRMVAQVCRQCTHQSSQVKEGFFLCEQGCSVGHALASHVRGQRKFTP
jgi:hypothetical protein